MSLLLSVVVLASRADDIQWLATEYDFGSFDEDAGKRSGEVRFVNRGNTPTVINRVKSTCGCTVAGFSDAEIAPGDTASVTFTYDPAGRPGRFEKHIKVYTGADNRLTSITIRGTVIGSNSSLSTQYPVKGKQSRLSTDTLNIGEILLGKSRNEFIYGYNQSPDTLSVNWEATDSPLSLGVASPVVLPGDLFTVGVFLNTSGNTTPGQHSFPIDLKVGDDTFRIIVNADIKPRPTAVGVNEFRKSPRLEITPKTIDLGEIKFSAKERTLGFELKNTGVSPLRILRITSPSKAVKTLSIPSKLKPGKSSKATLRLNPAEIPLGPFRIEIYTYSTDPVTPVATTTIIGSIIQ